MNTSFSDILIDDHSPLTRTLKEADFIPNWAKNGLKRGWIALTQEEIQSIQDASAPVEE